VTPVPTALPGVIRLQPPVHRDPRGSFVETFHQDWLQHLPRGTRFLRDARSTSAQAHTLRGLHAQHGLAKLVGVAWGRVLDVVVDLRPDSPTRGQHVSLPLGAERGELLWVPQGCAHGFFTLTPDAVVTYRMTTGYAPADEVGVRWDDPDLAIDWPAPPAVLSERDAALGTLAAALEALA